MKAIQTILAIASLWTAATTYSEAQGLAGITDAISEKRQLTNLPTFYLSTVDTVPVVSKDVYVKGTLYVAGPVEQAGKYNDSIEIRGRGNSTWGMPKKPYRTKLYNKYNLLDMPAKDKTWPILANYADKTLIRNALAFEISKLCGVYYTPAYRFVDVVLNDEFLGNYLATDQVEVSGDRVDVVKQAVTDSVLPAISGGYLLEIDGFAITTPVEGATFPEGFYSANNTPVSIKYPKDDEINKAQRDYIIDHFNKFETSILTYKKGEQIDSISKYLNIDAFVNWYIASELCANPDFIWSIYMKKDSGNMQMSFGPLWDNDISFANDSRLGDTRDELMLHKAHNCGSMRALLQRLFAIPAINQKVKARWAEIRDAGLKDRLTTFIDSTSTAIDSSQKLNFERWPILDQTVYLELEARGSYEAEVDFLRTFMNDHITSLDSIFNTFEDQMKLFELNENVWYSLSNPAVNKVLDIQNNSTDDYTPTVLWTDLEGAMESQLFRFSTLDNAYYTVTNKGSNKVLEAMLEFIPDSEEPYTPADYTLCINTYNATNESQLWKLEEIQPGIFMLVNKYSGLAIDNYDGGSLDGNEINTWTASASNPNQQWKFNAVTLVDPNTPEHRLHEANANIFTTSECVHIESKVTAPLLITDLNGKIIFQRMINATSYEITLQSGTYVIKVDNTIYKVIIP